MMLQEKNVLQDILVLDKDIMKKYADSIIESSCPKERNLLEKNFGSTAKDQFCVYQSMVERGYYPVKNADPLEVREAKQQMTQVANSLPSPVCYEPAADKQNKTSAPAKKSTKTAKTESKSRSKKTYATNK